MNYKILHRQFKKDGIYWSRKTFSQSHGRISSIITLALDEFDISIQRELPDHEKCLLCRESKPHTIELHDEMVEAWYSTQESDGQIKQLQYVDDKMEWEILNAEAETRPVDWSIVTKEYTQQQVDAMWQ
jgi:hypothetical protein